MSETSTLTTEETRAVAIACAVIETVRETGDNGAPAGHLYAGLMNLITLNAFDDMMGRLVRMGLLAKRGQCYHLGRAYEGHALC